MRYFYRDTNTHDTDNWQEISRKNAEDDIAATYGEENGILKMIEAGTPFNCSVNGGQIRAEAHEDDSQDEQAMNAQVEMPRYQCHKKVWALKIGSIIFDRDVAREEGRETDGYATITPADPGYAQFEVDADYVTKHKPQAGGYYVVYEDGYKSFSPAEAFESGYTRI